MARTPPDAQRKSPADAGVRQTAGPKVFGESDIEILPPGTTRRDIDDLIQLARLLDNAFVIPGIKVRFGLDSILGLVPGAGDAIGALLSLYIMGRAKQLGAPDKLIARMGVNVAIDTVLGAVPLFGDLFDVAYKANVKNVRLLLDHLGIEDERITPKKRGRRA
jgi:hypothetical protein